MPDKIFPWDLPERVYFHIEIDPVVAYDLNEGDENEKMAIGLIAEAWNNRPAKYADYKPGLLIPRSYGWRAGESKALENYGKETRETMKAGFELIKEIAAESKMSFGEVQQRLAANDFSVCGDRAEQVIDMAANKEESAITYERLQASLLIRRAIPAWKPEHIKALPTSVLDEILRLAYLEENHIKKETAPEGEKLTLSST